MDDDKPYEERRGGSYVREADGSLRQVAGTESADSPAVAVEQATGLAAAPADTEVPRVGDPPADPPGGAPPVDGEPGAPAEPSAKSRKGR